MQTFAEVERALQPYIQIASQTTGSDITIDRTRRLAAHVGNPERRLNVIHVAGTSGKTSTCYMIRHQLERVGQRTGLTVSPHIRVISERVQIDSQPLDETTFCRYMTEFLQVIADHDEMPTYFELMMVFAYWVFVREGVDYAVIETGLGGEQDSSNISQQSDKLSVITDTGYDHMHVLGDTLPQIARQKAGIIAQSGDAVMYRQSDEIMYTVRAVTDERSAMLHVIDPPDTDDYRRRNATLAGAVYQILAERDGLPELDDAVDVAAAVEVPGRLTVQQGVIYDGAHNAQKVAALVRTLQSQYPDQRFTVVLAMKQGKEYRDMIAALAPITERAIVTSFAAVQDAPITSIDPNILAEEYRCHDVEVTLADSLPSALQQAHNSDAPILVTGSLYAVSELLS